MAKKIICVVAGLVLSVLELVCLGVSPLTALSCVVLPVGFTALCFWGLTDYLEDKKITPLMIACYACAFVAIALFGAALELNMMVLFIVAAVFAVAGIVCYLIEKQLLKKSSAVEAVDAK